MKYFNSLPNNVINSLRVFVLFYGILAFYYWIINLPAGIGDEGLMASYLDDARKTGFFKYLVSGNFSIPHFLLLYFPSHFFSSFLILRIISLLFALLIFIYIKNRFPIKYPEFKYHLLFYLCSGSFFLGTNDTLMIFFLIVFFLECLRVIEGLDKQLAFFAPSSLITALFTREMSIIYLPVIILAFWFLRNHKVFSGKMIVMTICTFIFWFALNVPSLMNNGRLSLDNKIQEKQLGVSWEQLKYLSQVYANEGKIPTYQYLKWTEVREYLDVNGENSLPKTTFEAIFFDIKLTIIESFKDFGYIIFSGLRQISIAILFPFIVGAVLLLRRSVSGSLLFLAGIVLSVMAIFAVIIIAYIEIRWLATAFVLAIVGWYLFLSGLQNQKVYRIVNILILILLCCYGSITYFFRIFAG